jgi:DNA-binding MarR family transcriptional regulator
VLAREPLPEALAEELGPLLGRAHAAHRAIAERALAPIGLQPKAVGALAVLVAEGPLSQQRLGERQGIDRTTMVAVIDELEGSGLVERRRDAGDRRAYALHATAAGRRAASRAQAATAHAEAEFLASLAPGERAALKATLRRLVEAAGARD